MKEEEIKVGSQWTRKGETLIRTVVAITSKQVAVTKNGDDEISVWSYKYWLENFEHYRPKVTKTVWLYLLREPRFQELLILYYDQEHDQSFFLCDLLAKKQITITEGEGM